MKKFLVLFFAVLFSGFVFAAPWDFLRAGIDAATLISPIVSWVVMILALGVMLVALLALKKKVSRRLLLVSAAFVLFFIKSALSLVDMYVSPGIFMNFFVQGFFDFLIIISLFIALFRK